MRKFLSYIAVFSIVFSVIPVIPGEVIADSATIDFEAYTDGSIDGQDGWSSFGPYDHEVVSGSGVSGFGAKSFRISNAVTSGSFGDHSFSKSASQAAGETGAQGGTFSSAPVYNGYEAEFDIASTIDGEQPGLFMQVSPDRGDGARMSYVGFDDEPDGIHVVFYDYQDVAPFGASLGDSDGCSGLDDFVFTDIATIDRVNPHTIKIRMNLVDGPRNDVVEVYVDGSLVHTGTSWEDYFRYCEGNETRTVDSLAFFTRGTSAPATDGFGYLVDNLTVSTQPFAKAPRSGEISSPTANQNVVDGSLELLAQLKNDDDWDDNVQWAVRYNTCDAATNTVAGNVDGFSDTFSWDNENFEANFDVRNWNPGRYCFIFNPTETAGDLAVRETQIFYINQDPIGPGAPLECGLNIVKNPSFEAPVVTTAQKWDVVPSWTTPGLEWRAMWLTDDETAPLPANIELHRGVSGWNAQQGSQHTELDSDWDGPGGISGAPASIHMYQDLATKPGAEYKVSFWTSPRPGQGESQNRTEFAVDGTVMDTIIENGTGLTNTQWTQHNYSFIASAAITRISFTDRGLSDGLGGFLDNVSVVEDCESNVTLCKLDEYQNPLADWQVMLRGDWVDTVTILPDGTNYSSVALDAGDYLLEASGTYVYRPSAPDANISDAAFSKRLPTDTVYGIGSYQPWVRVNDFPIPVTGYLGIQVNNSNIDWGSFFNPDHDYSAIYNVGTSGPIDFRILDDGYADNSGSLKVKIYKAYSGVTGEDGCVTISDVPHGTYQLDEIMQEGWVNISGQGQEVVLSDINHNYQIVNDCTDESCEMLRPCMAGSGWAYAVVDNFQGTRKDGSPVLPTRNDPADVLGPDDWNPGDTTGFHSLGVGGWVEVEFERYVVDVPESNDISIHEATNGTYPEENALLEVSQDGLTWVTLGTASSNDHVSYYDLQGTGLDWIKFLRVTDTTNYSIHTASGDGFDLDAIDTTQEECEPPVPVDPPCTFDTSDNTVFEVVLDTLTSLIAEDEGDPECQIMGKVYNDENQNNVFDEGSEVGLSDWIVDLYEADNSGDGAMPVRTETSNENGDFKFINVAAGCYILREQLQPGWEITEPTPVAKEYKIAIGDVMCNFEEEVVAVGFVDSVLHSLGGLFIKTASAQELPPIESYNFGNHDVGGKGGSSGSGSSSSGSVLGDSTNTPSSDQGGNDQLNPRVLGATDELPRTGAPITLMITLSLLLAAVISPKIIDLKQSE
ncbi:MAG: hypothetical protein R3B41_03270 [Candidatus Doudnabacteria bacterium]